MTNTLHVCTHLRYHQGHHNLAAEQFRLAVSAGRGGLSQSDNSESETMIGHEQSHGVTRSFEASLMLGQHLLASGDPDEAVVRNVNGI